MSAASTPEISVLLPFYNAADTLPAAVESIVRQTHGNWECVLVDDGSGDSSTSFASDLVGRDSHFRLLHQPHEGLVAALNAGLRSCRGGFVARMDADDISLPARLELQAELLRGNPGVAAVGCRVRTFTSGGEPPPGGMLEYERWQNLLLTHEDITRDIFVESPFAHPSVMFRREAVTRLGGYREFCGPEDYDLWLRLWRSGVRFAKCPETLLEWRDGAGRLSRSCPRYSEESFFRLKLEHLLSTYLRGRTEVTIWGAGRGGRKWGRALAASGIGVSRFIDIDPRKIGRTAQGAPILPPEALADKQHGGFILATVASRGARDLIRPRLLDMGYKEMDDFVFTA